MKRYNALIITAAFAATTYAQPELKGTPSELTAYLAGLPKIATISGQAEIKIQADQAYVNLKVKTESRSLENALKTNTALRKQVMQELKDKGIPEQNMSGSKFSSHPEYGIFSNKAKSYKINNTIRVIIADETQLCLVAASVDAHEDVVYAGITFEDSKESENKQKAISEACKAVKNKMQLYKTQLGVKLTPISFTQGQVYKENNTARERNTYARKAISNSILSLSEASTEGGISQFGEIVYKATVNAEYQVNAE